MKIAAVVSAAALLLAALSAPAADDPAPRPRDKLTPARQHLDAGRWSDAIEELKRVDDRGSADWNNLMGYANRKSRPPDLEAAERYYDAALRLQPQHRGALEYSGELYLEKGDLARAEQRLASLERACAARCEEYADLKKAIADWRAKSPK